MSEAGGEVVLAQQSEDQEGLGEVEKKQRLGLAREGKLPSGKTATWLRYDAPSDYEKGFTLGPDISSRFARPGLLQNEPGGSQLKRTNLGVHVPPEIDQAGRDADKQPGGWGEEEDDDYTNVVGRVMNWRQNDNGEWIIPKDQMEKISAEEYLAIYRERKRRLFEKQTAVK